MKQNIHPHYGPVTFRDQTTGSEFRTNSTLARPGEEVVLTVDVTSDSHPFWTGSQNKLDTEGRVAAFNRRYGK